MFRALLAHPQEAIHKRNLVYCVRIMSVGCGTVAVLLQPCVLCCALIRLVPATVFSGEIKGYCKWVKEYVYMESAYLERFRPGGTNSL
jgi:hypothetical protein